MPDEVTPSSQVIDTPEAAGAAAGDAPVTPPAETTPPPGEEQPANDWSDSAKAEITKTRNEAANYRTQLREAQAALKNAKTAEEFEAATKEMGEKIAKLEHDALRTSVATAAKLPPELAARLVGSTKEELEADAQALAKLLPAEDPESLGGGLDPSDQGDDDEKLTPRELAAKYRKGR